ncbi:polysaccharide deacetylase family protein [Natronorarus salvus]|uniref:polysaccharide deacetylase family protein n=1 Tax=Natronorarus salvus TaxID=3117733 RepID=UPI002F2685AA
MRSVAGRTTTRRGFLAAAGAGAVALGSTVPAAAEGDGMVVFVYDDSPVEDYTETYEVHQEYDAPGCIAACPGLMNSSEQWMADDQLAEMYEDGWEVQAHTIDHRNLGEVELTGAVSEGEMELPVASNLQGRFEGDPLVVFDGESEVEATVADRDGGGDAQYIVLEEGIGASFEAGATVRYTDEFTDGILTDSKAMLEEAIGAEGVVTGHVHTYDRSQGYVGEAVGEFFDAVPNARGSGNGLLPDTNVDPLALSRQYYETDYMAEEEIDTFMASIANEPDFGILAGHSQFETLPTERVDLALSLAEEHGVRVVTLQEALAEFGVMEVPTPPTPTPTPTPTSTENESDDDAGSRDDNDDEGESMSLFERILAFLRSLFG